LHGNSENCGIFEPQVEYFSKTRTVIALDSRGHGRSSFGADELSITNMAEDVRAVLDALNVKTADLLGFSDGGNVALAFALRYPSRLRSLILSGANLSPGGVKWRVQAPIVICYWFLSLQAPFSENARRKRQIFGLMVNQPHFTPEEIAAITTPALVIAGERDMIREEHTKLIHRSIPGSKLVIVPEADHFVSSRKPDVFNSIVDEFLKDATK
jgi:pimeloyl-ACP methyl ester carboxylesterase